MTAGLEANLNLAVGARVMTLLGRNIDTKTGLVNGAIGTIQNISITAVTVKFDHIHKPYDAEKVKSRFMEYSFHSFYRDHPQV